MSVAAVPSGFHTLNTYLVVRDVPKLIDFCTRAFGAREMHRSLDGERVAHVTMSIGDSIVMAGEAPDDAWHMPSNIYMYVEECDATFAHAVAAGGTSIMEPDSKFYGDRQGGVTDPCGNNWWISTRVEDVAPDELARRHAAEMERRRATSV